MIIGKVAKAQGIKGELKLNLDIDFDKIENLEEFIIGGKNYKIEQIGKRTNGIFVKLFGVNDRNYAESLRMLDIEVERKNLKELSANEFYFEDLIDAKVYDENGKEIGRIEDIEQYGAADVVIINQNGRLYSVPFLDDIFIKFDSNSKIMIVDKERYNNMKVL